MNPFAALPAHRRRALTEIEESIPYGRTTPDAAAVVDARTTADLIALMVGQGAAG